MDLRSEVDRLRGQLERQHAWADYQAARIHSLQQRAKRLEQRVNTLTKSRDLWRNRALRKGKR